ncbi:hypothetical protein XarbCFBP8150_04520 [Xanthomonas arboricola]|nr:hypothetical protein XarbCFBP8150_04520 [Xanthomonas arboricola]
MHTDHFHWSLPAHRRGILRGMDAAPEPTRTYLRRVLRWWAGKDQWKWSVCTVTIQPLGTQRPKQPRLHAIVFVSRS